MWIVAQGAMSWEKGLGCVGWWSGVELWCAALAYEDHVLPSMPSGPCLFVLEKVEDNIC